MEVRVSRHKHSNRYLSSFFVFLNIKIIIFPANARARNHKGNGFCGWSAADTFSVSKQ
jgi:hypothetical protein